MEIVRISAGNAMEWFDWLAYATFSVFFAAQFFGTGDGAISLLKTLAVFAVGFVARPFGGMFFGWLADRRGRKPAMLLTVALAAGGSLLIGLTPTAHTIGVLAPIILVIARLAQGLAHGGEIPSAQTYLAEAAPRQRRGLWSSAIYVSGHFGIITASALGAALSGLLSHEQMTSFGWRIPFILGALFGIYAMIMRTRLPETDVFRVDNAADMSGSRSSGLRGILAHPRAMAQVLLLTAGTTLGFYRWNTVTVYAIDTKHTDPTQALWASSAAHVLLLLALPAWGALSDRIGRKPVLFTGILVSSVLTVPMMDLIQGEAWQLFVATAVTSIFGASVSAVAPAVMAELFPTGIRAVGVGLPYALAVALFGGTAPYLQAYFAQIGQTELFNGYSILMLLISAGAVFSLRETKCINLAETSKPAEKI
jgi:MFS transporter, MHS family, alpha-ketoglutarate permease